MKMVQPIPTSTPAGQGKALDFTMARFIAVVTELNTARQQLAAIRALVTHARKISPSPTMSVYVLELERALGLTDQAAPRKVGLDG